VRVRGEPGDFRFLIDLPVQNEWSNVDLVRTSVLGCFTAIFTEVEDCQTFATVASELMENAIKYGDWDDDGPRHLHLRVWGDARTAHVQVEQPIAEGAANVRELFATIAWLNGFADVGEAYRLRLLEIAGEPVGATKLGLARIAYEGRCKLAAEIDGRTLRVTGVTTLAPGGRASESRA
jgi:hypothetical protein